MRYSARVQILTGYAGLARSLGLSPEALARSVGLNLSSLHELDARISAKAFADLLERSAEASGVEEFGLWLAESRELGILGPIGIVVHQEPDLRSALRSLSRYLPYHNESLKLTLKEEGTVAVLSLEVRTAGRQATELSIGAFFRILRRLAGSRWKPSYVCFEHSATRSLTTHRRFFGCQVEFGADFNGIVFRAQDLDTPLAMSDAMLSRYAHRYLETMFVHSNESFSEKTQELIRLLLSSGSCNTEKVARGLGVNRRTVHRHLVANGQTFSAVLTSVRIEMVRTLLSNQKPLSEIADRLGFSSPASFSRWFRQQFGCSPTAWRGLSPHER